MKYKNESLPAHEGRPMITDEMILENPHLKDMIHRASNYWERDDFIAAYLGIKDIKG